MDDFNHVDEQLGVATAVAAAHGGTFSSTDSAADCICAVTPSYDADPS